MKSTCPECKGKGEVMVEDYRSNAKPPEEETKKTSLKPTKMKKKIKIGWPLVFSILILTLVVGGFAGCIVSSNIYDKDMQPINDQKKSWDTIEANAKQEAYQRQEDRKGFVVAQYSSDGKVQRCWVVHTLNQIQVNGASASVPVNDMNDIKGFALKIGIEEPDKCFR